MSCTVWAIMSTNTFNLKWRDNAALRLSNMKGWTLLMLHWRSFLGWGNNKQTSNAQSCYATNHKLVIDIQYWVSNYYRLHSDALWPLNFWSTSMHIMWQRDGVSLSHSCALGRQLMACTSCHQFLINIARLPHHSSSNYFSLISMTYHQQFQLS